MPLDRHADRLGVCGDSAGGSLAALACQALGYAGAPPLALQLLLCPILDYGPDEAREFGRGIIDRATLDADLQHYLRPGIDPADPRISPLHAQDLQRMPITIIHTGEFDPFRDAGRRYYERLLETGSRATYTCHPGMIHLFYGLAGVIPYARTFFTTLTGELRPALERPATHRAEV